MNNTTTTTSNWEEKSPIILAVLLLVFFLAKIAHIYTPLFHDELGVYGQALFYMLDHGSSMVPDGMPTVLSRGHPAFFVYFLSLFTSLFGGTAAAAKFVILLLSLGTLATTYFLGKEMVNKKVGLLAAILLAFQPVFFAQSTMVLPEVMLALLGLLSVLFYLKDRYWLYFIFASLVILTKETGIVLFAGVALNEWYKDRFRISLGLIGRGLKWSAPISCFILFLIVQKQQHGWYLYPYHTGFISFAFTDIWERFFLCAKHLFHDQGRFVLSIAAIITLVKIDKEKRKALLDQNILSIAICLMFFGFSSLNYFMARYQVVIFPLFIISLLSVITVKVESYRYFMIYLAFTLPFHYNASTFRTDENMNYLITVDHLKESIAELDKITDGKPVKVFALFPEIWALIDPRHGYTNNPNYILYDTYNDSCDYILRGSNAPFDANELACPLDSILYNPKALEASKIEQLYSSQHYYSNQRIFKTNN